MMRMAPQHIREMMQWESMDEFYMKYGKDVEEMGYDMESMDMESKADKGKGNKPRSDHSEEEDHDHEEEEEASVEDDAESMESMEDQENMAAAKDWYMSMFKDEAIEGMMRMQPYEEHVQFKYCLALPKMIEMMGEMMEMAESPSGGMSPSMSGYKDSSSSSYGKSGYEKESYSEDMRESMPEGEKGGKGKGNKN